MTKFEELEEDFYRFIVFELPWIPEENIRPTAHQLAVVAFSRLVW